MIREYVREMACVIAECARVLKPHAPCVMVNDHVRCACVSIPMDLILADLARRLGFRVERIIVVMDNKGNSSQQMREYGRDPLRTWVSIWRKADA